MYSDVKLPFHFYCPMYLLYLCLLSESFTVLHTHTIGDTGLWDCCSQCLVCELMLGLRYLCF